MKHSKYFLLLLLILNQSCSCEDSFNQSPITPYPPDTSCKLDNPHAIYDPTISELCDGSDNNCDCLEKPLEEQDTNGDLQKCGPGDEGVDEGCECWSEGKEYSVGWASGKRDCWLNEEGYDLGDLRAHTNPVGTLHGECEYGSQICRPLPSGGSEWGMWLDGYDQVGGTEDDEWVKGGCLGAIGPHTEVCDGKDNNCDTHVDEGLKKMCWSGAVKEDGSPQDWLVFNSPSTSETPCRTGIQLCQNARWSGCLNEVLPESEICDSIDNDCDGNIDDNSFGSGNFCGLTDAGICEYGSLECNGNDLICSGERLPQIEACDNVDNDCDDKIDEELIRPCESICGSGFETCNAGDWKRCSAQQPVEEVCDAEDNDCDGAVDEGLECSCPPEFLGALVPCINNPRLVCGGGFMECICVDPNCTRTAFSECMAMCAFEDPVQPACDPTGGAPTLEECNGWDDDCDQDIDEGLLAECYTGSPGTENVGECSPGSASCHMGRWGNESSGIFIQGLCNGEILPEEEVCDHLDNDCDGAVDEELDSHDKVDMVFAIDRSGSMCDKIIALQGGIQPYVLAYANTEHRFALVNIPGQGRVDRPPDIEIDFVDSITFAAALAQLGCDLWNIEPQYDAIESIATNSIGLNFRADAWPMVVILSDENAQSIRVPKLTAANVRDSITPCQVGNCEVDDTLEVFAIVLEVFFPEWCAPANIAEKCYQLYGGIDAAVIRGYLDDIFSDVCR